MDSIRHSMRFTRWIPMAERAWKRAERRVAEELDTTRIPINGRVGSDLAHPRLAVEVKHPARMNITVLKQALDQAEDAARKDGRIPVAIIHEHGLHMGSSLVVTRLR